MLICPRCEATLEPAKGQLGMMWSCPRCHGRAIGAAVLRRAVAASAAEELWSKARNGSTSKGADCPSCRRPTREVSLAVEGGESLALDVCATCQFVWCDADELESLPVTEVGVAEGRKALADEALARFDLEHEKRMRELRRIQRRPEEPWKLLPALIGLPVEMDPPGEAESPWATWALIALTVALSLVGFGNHELIAGWGFVPEHALRNGGATVLTSFFLHAGVLHLLFNMYWLWIFGDDVEAVAGKGKYLVLILVASVAGCLAHALLTRRPELPLVGASGGISGVAAYYTVAFPRARLGILIPFRWTSMRWLHFSARTALYLWLGLQALGTLSGLSSISHAGHLGGAVVGLWFGYFDSRRRT
jgi:membrane associated rhomboid family serine protease